MISLATYGFRLEPHCIPSNNNYRIICFVWNSISMWNRCPLESRFDSLSDSFLHFLRVSYRWREVNIEVMCVPAYSPGRISARNSERITDFVHVIWRTRVASLMKSKRRRAKLRKCNEEATEKSYGYQISKESLRTVSYLSHTHVYTLSLKSLVHPTLFKWNKLSCGCREFLLKILLSCID